VITTTMKIYGMHCEACAERLVSLLSKEPGVREAPVFFADSSARVRFNPQVVSEKRLVEVVEQGGFTVVAPGL
jgi:copper chaperone CopZ